MPLLRVETGPQKNQAFALRPPGPYRLGRDVDADFPLFDRRVSRNHFRIDMSDEGYRITDLESKGGTFLNDARVESALLATGDRIVAGRTLFTFLLDAPTDPLVGRHLGGYKVLERVGRGAMGTVYRAQQLSLDRVVALKVLSDELARDSDFGALFIREARAAGELSHPNIVRVYDVNMLDGILFYVMEFMARGSVDDLLRREGALTVQAALKVAAEAASGLVYAEEAGIVHRDIKPSNLMVHESGAVKIGDLGIATRSGDRSGTQRHRGITGSPHYMAPEQALGRPVDGRADVYALGVTLYQLLAGVPPFRGDTLKELLYAHIQEMPRDIRALRRDVSDPVAALLKSLLEKDPTKRPNALAAKQALETLEAEEGRRRSRAPARRPRRPRKVLRLVLIGAFTFVLGSLGGFFLNYLGGVIGQTNARIERVRNAIAQGRGFLRSGDVEGARSKLDEVSGLRVDTDEWPLLELEFEAFERAVRAAESSKR
jgi:hypothetical protein